MSDITWFAEHLLRLFSSKKEAYYNLFGASQSYLRHVLGHEPTEEELVAAQRAFHELRDKGYIYDVSGEHWYRTTQTGKKALETGAYKTEAGKRLLEFISYPRIIQASAQAFDGGRFADSVFHATKIVEVAVREKAQLPPNVIGRDVMTQAFKPGSGKLVFPMCETDAEADGAMFLYMGMIAFFKNPESHRFTDWIDSEVAIRALQNAELLLKILDKTSARA